MIKTNAILFATLLAFCIGQNVEDKNYVRKQAIAPELLMGHMYYMAMILFL